MNVLKNPMYLGDRGTRTLFSIEIFNGKSIKAHSFFKKEKEVLLLPGTYFEVTGHLDSGNDLNIIHLKQKHPPFVLLEPPFRQEVEKSSREASMSVEHKQGQHSSPAPPSLSTHPPASKPLRKLLNSC